MVRDQQGPGVSGDSEQTKPGDPRPLVGGEEATAHDTIEPGKEPPEVREAAAPWSDQWLDDVFTYHPPTDEDARRYGYLREKARKLAGTIRDVCPASADRTAALRLLRQALMTANASIATRGTA